MPCRLILSLALLALSACSRPTTPVVLHPDHPAIRYTGWFDTRVARAPRFAWPGTQIALTFTGSSLHARLADAPVEDETRETDWITVVIDDRPPKTFALAEGLHVYPLATQLEDGQHRAVIWKRTEAEVGVITFQGFVLNGVAIAERSSARPRRMVFVGDSITAGYGNEGPDASCHWSAARENNYETFGARAARALGAEYAAMAWSGKGVSRNYEERDVLAMPQLYTRVIPSEDDSPQIPSTRADVVVVNLGTNDFFLGLPDPARFSAAYRSLLDALRARYPEALFVLALGPMLADDYPQPNARSLLRGWISSERDARLARGDARVELMELWIDPAEGVGCDFHPNVKTHARLGRELADLVRARLAW